MRELLTVGVAVVLLFMLAMCGQVRADELPYGDAASNIPWDKVQYVTTEASCLAPAKSRTGAALDNDEGLVGPAYEMLSKSWYLKHDGELVLVVYRRCNSG